MCLKKDDNIKMSLQSVHFHNCVQGGESVSYALHMFTDQICSRSRRVALRPVDVSANLAGMSALIKIFERGKWTTKVTDIANKLLQ